MKTDVQLLDPQLLVKTSDLDQADWNFKPVLGAIQRRRFQLAADLLGHGHGRLLEVGYGSGVFAPELSTRCEELHGIDVHDRPGEVMTALASVGLTAGYLTAPAESLPYPDRHFDAIVSVSALEFVDDISRVCSEMHRVLRPGGTAVFITPGHARVLDLGLRVLTGERAEDTFQGRRQLVLPALRQGFQVTTERRFPNLPGGWLYTTVRATSVGAVNSAPRLRLVSSRSAA